VIRLQTQNKGIKQMDIATQAAIIGLAIILVGVIFIQIIKIIGAK
jgi:hypothetical protein